MNIYTIIKYKEHNIGYFPEFENLLKHGFSWGKNIGNMSFAFGNKNEVKKNVQNFLHILNVGNINESFVISPEHSDNIVEIDKVHDSSELGIEISCDVLITQMKNTTLTLKPGDCTSVILYAIDSSNKPIVALIHLGRRGVELLLPIKVINHLKNRYGVKVKDIKIGIVPHLFKENRKFENIDKLDKSVWGNFIEEKNGFFFPMETEFAINQYKSAEVLDKNIFLYEVDTYEATKKGDSFSYKYSLEMRKKGVETQEGRFIIAVSL